MNNPHIILEFSSYVAPLNYSGLNALRELARCASDGERKELPQIVWLCVYKLPHITEELQKGGRINGSEGLKVGWEMGM